MRVSSTLPTTPSTPPPTTTATGARSCSSPARGESAYSSTGRINSNALSVRSLGYRYRARPPSSRTRPDRPRSPGNTHSGSRSRDKRCLTRAKQVIETASAARGDKEVRGARSRRAVRPLPPRNEHIVRRPHTKSIEHVIDRKPCPRDELQVRTHGCPFNCVTIRLPTGHPTLAIDQHQVLAFRCNEIGEPSNKAVRPPKRALESPAQQALPPGIDFPPAHRELLGDISLMSIAYRFPLLKARHECSVAHSAECVARHGLNPASLMQSQ